MSMAAMVQEILADTHLLVSSTDVYRKICASMRHHREKRLWFSDRKFQFNLIQGVSEYGPDQGVPPDLVEISGKVIWTLIGGDESSRWGVQRVTHNDFDRLRIAGSTVQSQPSYWDWFANRLRLYPVPVSSTDLLEGRYVVDIGVPVVKYESGSFVFYDPAGTTKWDSTQLDAYNNDWLDPKGAYHLIRTRALHLLYKETLHDSDMANDYLSSWLEQVGVMEDETDAKDVGNTTISPCILDDDALRSW